MRWLKFWLPIILGGFGELFLAAPACAEGRLAIIIDDIGFSKTQSVRAANLKGRFTLSVLPFTPHGLVCATIAHRQGKEIMLHLPMSTINNMPIGKGGLGSEMSQADFIAAVRHDLDSMEYIEGVNNHMGSRLTQEAEPMRWLMTVLKERGLYFVDSRTSAKTVALDVAQEFKVPSIKRDVFLDDINDPDAIKYQLNRAIQIARQRGLAVAIGHPYPATLGVLEQAEPVLSAQGVGLVYVSELLERVSEPDLPPAAVVSDKGGGPASCPAPAHDDGAGWLRLDYVRPGSTAGRAPYLGY